MAKNYGNNVPRLLGICMKHFIETHFGLILALSCIAGLVVPGLPDLPNASAAVALAMLMFVSCYKLQEGGFSSLRWRDIGLFYVLRYMVLPLVLWFVASLVVPAYAIAIFLVSMMPAGVASPAFAGIYGGTLPPAFAIAILTQLLTPLLVPLLFTLIGSGAVTPSPAHLFHTLVVCILLPMGVYALVKKHRASNAYFSAQNKFFSILIISFVIALAVSKQRDVILGDPLGILPSLAIVFICYFIYLAFGWLVFKRPRPERIAYATCSSFNNIALAVSLALLHFDALVILFVAVGEIAWSLLPLMMKLWLRFFAR